MRTITERVAAGEAFLDEHDPGWADLINLNLLELENCSRCVLGQIYGGYVDGLGAHRLSGWAATNLGFTDAHGEFDALTAEWKRVITGRRAAS